MYRAASRSIPKRSVSISPVGMIVRGANVDFSASSGDQVGVLQPLIIIPSSPAYSQSKAHLRAKVEDEDGIVEIVNLVGRHIRQPDGSLMDLYGLDSSASCWSPYYQMLCQELLSPRDRDRIELLLPYE